MQPQLSRSDAHRVLQLIEECADLWDDPAAWQRHVATSVERMIGGFAGLLMRRAYLQERGRRLEDSLGELIDDASSRSLERFLSEGGPTLVPSGDKVPTILRERGWCAAQVTELAGRRAYYGSSFYRDYMRPIGAHDTIFAAAPCSTATITTLSISRERSDPPFSAGQKNLLAALVAALAPRIGTRLVTSEQRGRHDLSRRQNETLSALLAGDSEKQIAARLGVSALTVHDYVKSLYRYFGVNSRGELMSYFIRRQPMSKPPAPTAGRLHGRAAKRST